MRKNLIRSAAAVLIAGCMVSSCVFSAGAAVITEPDVTELPSSYSSKDMGYVTPAKSQIGNNCWAFAALATFESSLLHEGYENVDMSFDHINLWAVTRSNDKGWLRSFSDSGYSSSALGYLTSWQGSVLKSDLPDFNMYDYSYGDQAPTDLARYGINAAQTFYGKDNPGEIKRAIYNHGGVYTCYSNAGSCFGNGLTTYYMPISYSGSYAGHAIEIVGWDDNFDKNEFGSSSNGAIPNNNGAWLAKNSWGNNNSLDGFFWISYEDKDLFNSRYGRSFTVTRFEEIDDSKKLLQNEIYGATYEFDYAWSDNVTFINHFDFTNEFFTVDKVVFETESKGASYTVYFIPDSGNAPDEDRNHWIELSSGILPYNGYICDDIEDFEIPDSSGSIAVELDTSSLDKNATFGVDEWLTDKNNQYVFLNESQPGQSYISFDGETTDLLDWYKTNQNDEIGGTFVLKAIMKKTDDLLMGDVNLDGKVNINDATEVQKYLAHMIALSGKDVRAADFHSDGKVDINDATEIQRYIAKGVSG